jgi:RNA polymerase sigma-70 factor (ECF subfamily)
LTARGVDPDEQLVVRAGQGDQGAIRALIARKTARILSLAGRLLGDTVEAEDVAQETFLRIWRIAPHWRPGEARFDTWVHRVALNLCYDKLRRRAPTTNEAPEQVDPGPLPDRGLIARGVGDRVTRAIQELPPRQREAILLCHYQELSNIEAAIVMSVSVEALESLLARARRALRSKLIGLLNDD